MGQHKYYVSSLNVGTHDAFLYKFGKFEPIMKFDVEVN